MKKQIKQRQKIVVGINSLVSTVHSAYSNHIQLFFRLGRNYPNIDFILYNPSRLSIDRMRNTCAQIALDAEASHLLFLDDDVIVPFDCLGKLLEQDADVIAGDTLVRGYPFNHMAFSYTDKTRSGLKMFSKIPTNRRIVDKKGIAGRSKDWRYQIGAVGFSLCLIKTSLLKQISQPYFVTGPTSNTEDVYFCMKARQEVPNCSILWDTKLETAHILWSELIGESNVKNYRKYMEVQYPDDCKPEVVDRSPEYINAVKRDLDAA